MKNIHLDAIFCNAEVLKNGKRIIIVIDIGITEIYKIKLNKKLRRVLNLRLYFAFHKAWNFTNIYPRLSHRIPISNSYCFIF